MKLQNLSDETLDSNLRLLVSSEREILTDILHHLREVERRRLYSKYKYRSLFDYAVKRFGYSEDQAWRRISTMRLLKDLPEIEDKINSGTLSLSNLAQAQSLFRQEVKLSKGRTSEEKMALLSKLENRTKREASEILNKDSLIPQNLEMKISGTEHWFIASDSLQAKLDRLTELRSETSPIELHELLEQMADLALEKWDPVVKAKRILKQKSTLPAQKHRVTNQRRIPSRLKHEVTLRDQGKCTNCGETRKTQFDHYPKPWAQGGTHELKNLRLLCRSCNQRHAVETYGMKKMSRFLRSRVTRYEGLKTYLSGQSKTV